MAWNYLDTDTWTNFLDAILSRICQASESTRLGLGIPPHVPREQPEERGVIRYGIIICVNACEINHVSGFLYRCTNEFRGNGNNKSFPSDEASVMIQVGDV